MKIVSTKQNRTLFGLLFAALLAFMLMTLVCLPGMQITAYAEKGPAGGDSTAEITFVSKDKEDLDFMYLSGIVLNTDIKGASYDKESNTLTLNNVQLSKDDTHYSLTIANMGEDFKIEVVGNNSLDYLSLESLGYNTGCTITGYGVLEIGYLDISNDGKKMEVTVDNTVNFTIDSKKMGYDSLPAVKVSSKTPLMEMESMIKIYGDTKDQLVYEENPSTSSYAYETTINKVTIKPTKVVKKGTDGKWGFYVNDKLSNTYNGLAGNTLGLWVIQNGLVNFDYTGLLESDNVKYMIVNGKADLGFNGLCSDKDGTWFCQDGIVQKNYVGPVVLNGVKYSVDKGKIA